MILAQQALPALLERRGLWDRKARQALPVKMEPACISRTAILHWQR